MPLFSRNHEKDGAAREAYLDLAAAADEFEQYANPHAVRIATIADKLAEAFHMAPQDRKSLRTAARMHDLGEVAMEREYIQRAGSLTDEERIDLQRHPVIGEQEAARAGADRDVQLLVRWHHEWWNGSGYPDALSQNEIPLAARILRLADAYASLTDARPYRAALTEEDARIQIIERAAIEFDPAVVSVLLSLEDVEELRSFAKPDEPLTTTAAISAADKGSTLFSSFMK
jgi:HD-GYP domain-containing protein (c-di-GMP phosphodiesterase class II)